jgi:hypothetical protein
MATADNLKIAQQLLATMQQITAQVERQTEAYHAQAQLVDALCKAQECFGKIDADKVREVTDALREAQEKTKEFGVELANTAEKQAGKLEGAIGKIAEKVMKLSVPEEFLKGFSSGLKISTNLFKNILSMGGSAFGLLTDIAKVMFSLPGSLMDFFQGAASGGSDPYKEALEELREEFGDLSIGTSAAIINMTKSTKELGESGLALSRVFGYGHEGLAALLRENMALFKEMGPLGDRLAASLRGVEGEFTLLRKATGLTGEAMKAFQLRAEENGMTGAQATREMTLALAQGQRAFGISVKQFGRDMEVMLKDTVTFGILAPREMVKVSAYVKKLGISMETLKKVTDKAFNFEDAAQQAAKLSEAFGIALDPLKQMEADPVKKMDNLRQAFFKTGQRYESMSAQARKYLAEQAGISDEEARIAFSQKNRAMTGAQVEAQMKKQQKAQMSQAEAMKILAESVKRLVKSGEPMKGSFFDVFSKGFESGIKRSREFREVTRNLQRSMRTVFLAGRDVGRMFVKEFPGFKQMLKALADMFNPRRFRELMKNVVLEFRNFFKLLQTDPKAGVQEFMKNMKKIFFDFFSKGTPAGAKFLDGAKSFFKTIGVIFVEGLRYALNGLKNVLRIVIDFIKNPSSLTTGAAGALGEGLTGMFAEAFQYLATELGPIVKELGSIVVELFKTLYEKYIQPHLGKIVLGAIAFFFGPALILAFVRGATAGLMQVGVALITERIRRARNTVDGATRAPEGDRDTTPAGQARQAASIRDRAKGFAEIARAMILFTGAMFLMVAAIIGLAALYEASGVNAKSMLLITAVFGAVSLLFFGMIKSGILKSIEQFGSKANWKTIGNIAKGIGAGLAALGLLMIGTAVIVAIGVRILKDVKKESVELFLEVMGSMTLLFIGMSASLALLFAAGSLISGPQALPIILAIIAGFAVIGLFLIAIAEFAAYTIGNFVQEMNRAGVTAAYAKEVGGILINFVDVITKLSAALTLLALFGPFAAIGAIGTRLLGGKSPFETLTDIINKIKEAFVTILTTLNGITGDPAVLKAKAEVFTTIASGLGALMNPIVSLISNISDDFFVGSSAKAAATASYALIDIIKVLADKDRGVIPKLMDQIKGVAENLTVDPAKLKAAAELFTVIATGLSEIMKAVAELISKFDSGFSFNPVSLLGNMASMLAKIHALMEVTNTVLPAIQTVLRSMMTEVIAMSNTITNVEGLKAIGPILAAVTQLITGVLTAVSGLISDEGAGGFLNALNTLISGGSQTNVINDKLIAVQNFIGTFSGSIRRLLTGTDGRGGILGGIKQIVDSLPTEPTKLKALSTVSEIIKSVTSIIAPIIEAVGNLTKNIKTGGGINTSQINAVGNQISGVITSISTNFTSLFQNLPTLITNLTQISLPSGIDSKIKTLSSIFDMVKNIGSIISGFNINVGGGAQRTLNMWSEVFVPILTLLAFFGLSRGSRLVDIPNAQGHKETFEAVLNGINSIQFPHGMSDKVKTLKTVFDSLKSVAEATKALKELAGENNTTISPTVLDVPLQNIDNVLRSLTRTDASGGRGVNPLMDESSNNPLSKLGGISERLRGKPAKLTAIQGSLREMFSAATALRDLPDVANVSTTLTTRLNSFFGQTGVSSNSVLSVLDARFGSGANAQATGNQIEQITTNIREHALVPMRAMVTAYNDFIAEVRNLSSGDQPLQVALTALGTTLGGRQTLAVRNAAVNAQINVQVKIETKEIVSALETQSRNTTITDTPRFLPGLFVTAPVGSG